MIRESWIKRWWVAACYYVIPSCMLLALLLGHAGIQKNDYAYLDVFRQLERNNQTAEAKNDPQYQHLKPVLHKFKSSKEFARYLKPYDRAGDWLLALFLSWVGAFIFDLVFAIACLLRRFFKSRKIALF
ncbi:MAG: hypothetical protein ACPG7U_04320 [Holosporaceae bacterium]